MLKAYAVVVNAEEITGGTASELVKLLELMLTKIPLWIAAAIVMVLAFVVAKIGRVMVENKLAEQGIEEEHKEIQILGGRMTYSMILIIGVTVSLKIAGIDLTTILAAVAFGIGFALKDLIMNFLAGVMILIGRDFSIGDFINVGGTLGKVVAIQSRVTILQAIDGTKVIVPNAELFKKQVVSYTSNPFRRLEVIVSVDYRTNLENTLKVCMKSVKDTKKILAQPKPAVIIDRFEESSIRIKIRAWVESRSGWIKVKSNLITNIKKGFDEHGIIIPFPIRTIAYDKDMEFAEKMMEEEVKVEKPVAPEPVATPVPQPVPIAPGPEGEVKPTGESN
ncbi:mechanosensitive ion channel family protein [Candidatus Gracilibacteria bacterium]|nr:mechanosensitive ion channel family protein [Candidatus Gracilibacteria bacterium]